PGEGPLYYGEFFDVAETASRSDVASFFAERAHRHRHRVLNLVVDRIGKLGPDPRGVAVWQLPSYDDLEQAATELDGVAGPVSLVRAGLYADIGREILEHRRPRAPLQRRSACFATTRNSRIQRSSAGGEPSSPGHDGRAGPCTRDGLSGRESGSCRSDQSDCSREPDEDMG